MHRMQVFILGKTPLLSLAELESRYGASDFEVIDNIAAIYHKNDDIELPKLGGVQKIAEVIGSIDASNWKQARDHIEHNYMQLINPKPGSKLKLGISVYGFDQIKPAEINASCLTLKKKLKSNGISCRVIPNKQNELNSAQVIHGKLMSNSGFELVVIRKDKNTVLLCKTSAVQDIDAYSARDYNRPKRDSRVGMLPPKLAQIIVNLATSNLDPLLGHIVLDPFCGTGVVLQEAALMGFDVAGADLNPKMVEYTDENLMWLLNQPGFPVTRPKETQDDPKWRYYKLFQADATDHEYAKSMPAFSAIACETYLGRPLSSAPDKPTLDKIINDCDTIHKKFLANIARQTKPGFRMCIAVPSWYYKNSFLHLKTLEHLKNLGYNQLSFALCGGKPLLYHRKGQFVARELVVIQRV